MEYAKVYQSLWVGMPGMIKLRVPDAVCTQARADSVEWRLGDRFVAMTFVQHGDDTPTVLVRSDSGEIERPLDDLGLAPLIAEFITAQLLGD